MAKNPGYTNFSLVIKNKRIRVEYLFSGKRLFGDGKQWSGGGVYCYIFKIDDNYVFQNLKHEPFHIVNSVDKIAEYFKIKYNKEIWIDKSIMR